PTLLVDKDVSQTLKSARVLRLQLERSAIRSFSNVELARIARVVAIRDRVLKSFFNFSGRQPRTCRTIRVAATFCFRILGAKNSRAANQIAAGFLGGRADCGTRQ